MVSSPKSLYQMFLVCKDFFGKEKISVIYINWVQKNCCCVGLTTKWKLLDVKDALPTLVRISQWVITLSFINLGEDLDLHFLTIQPSSKRALLNHLCYLYSTLVRMFEMDNFWIIEQQLNLRFLSRIHLILNLTIA